MHKYDTATGIVTLHLKNEITQILKLSSSFVTPLTCEHKIEKQKITGLQTVEKIKTEIPGPGLL